MAMVKEEMIFAIACSSCVDNIKELVYFMSVHEYVWESVWEIVGQKIIFL